MKKLVNSKTAFIAVMLLSNSIMAACPKGTTNINVHYVSSAYENAQTLIMKISMLGGTATLSQPVYPGTTNVYCVTEYTDIKIIDRNNNIIAGPQFTYHLKYNEDNGTIFNDPYGPHNGFAPENKFYHAVAVKV